MLNLSLNELRLIAEHTNISDYQNRSIKDLIKALRGSRPRLGIKKNRLKEIKEIFIIEDISFLKKMQVSKEDFFMILKIIDIFLN